MSRKQNSRVSTTIHRDSRRSLSYSRTPCHMAWSSIYCFHGTPNASAWRVDEMRCVPFSQSPSLKKNGAGLRGSIKSFFKSYKWTRIRRVDARSLDNRPRRRKRVDCPGLGGATINPWKHWCAMERRQTNPTESAKAP